MNNLVHFVVGYVEIGFHFISIQSTVTKKKMYYNMRVKTLHRNKADLLSRLEDEKQALQALPEERIKKLWFNIKEVSRLEPRVRHKRKTVQTY